MRATSSKQVVHTNVSMSCYRGTFVWDSCLQLNALGMLEPECVTHLIIINVYSGIQLVHIIYY